jgi:hypothetical protein
MPAGVSAITALANLTLGANAVSVTFSSISGSYRDLILVIQGSTTSGQNIFVRFNGDSTATNYNIVSIAGLGSGTGSSQTVNSNYLNYWSNFDTSQGNLIAQFMDYSVTNKHKTFLSRQNTASVGVEAIAGRWSNTAAVTTLALLAATNFSSGTSFALYGVSA